MSTQDTEREERKSSLLAPLHIGTHLNGAALNQNGQTGSSTMTTAFITPVFLNAKLSLQILFSALEAISLGVVLQVTFCSTHFICASSVSSAVHLLWFVLLCASIVILWVYGYLVYHKDILSITFRTLGRDKWQLCLLSAPHHGQRKNFYLCLICYRFIPEWLISMVL